MGDRLGNERDPTPPQDPQGCSVERGTFEELVTLGGRFAELVRTQLSGPEQTKAAAAAVAA